jgi:cell division protease FtsH
VPQGAHEKAVEILNNNRELMTKISERLLDKETIMGDEFMNMVREEKVLEGVE